MDGGGGEADRLILTGDKDDYTFGKDPTDGYFRITDAGTTLIDTTDIELFTFDNGTFTAGELFTV
ncbi:MAG: hypothetical protein GY798_09370 [Hyphomicrobiales bacterium]|nr:hypothetical protein [Hyphomicrobiales bacterium]